MISSTELHISPKSYVTAHTITLFILLAKCHKCSSLLNLLWIWNVCMWVTLEKIVSQYHMLHTAVMNNVLRDVLSFHNYIHPYELSCFIDTSVKRVDISPLIGILMNSFSWVNISKRMESTVTLLPTSGVPRNFVRGGGFNKISWGQRTERTGIWGAVAP